MDNREFGNTLKVVAMGLDKRVLEEMSLPGFSVEGVTRKFKGEGIDITAQSIRKFIRKSKGAQQEMIAQDLNMAKQLTKTYIDYGNTLKQILTEVEEVKQQAKTDRDFATYNQMVDKLYKGLELIAKLTGDIDTRNIDIKIIYNEINSDMEKIMRPIRKDMFKEKIIDIDSDIIAEDKKYEKDLKGE
jgi:hypothetical protein